MKKMVVAIEVDGNDPVLSFFKAGSDDPVSFDYLDMKTQGRIADALASANRLVSHMAGRDEKGGVK